MSACDNCLKSSSRNLSDRYSHSYSEFHSQPAEWGVSLNRYSGAHIHDSPLNLAAYTSNDLFIYTHMEFFSI